MIYFSTSWECVREMVNSFEAFACRYIQMQWCQDCASLHSTGCFLSQSANRAEDYVQIKRSIKTNHVVLDQYLLQAQHHAARLLMVTRQPIQPNPSETTVYAGSHSFHASFTALYQRGAVHNESSASKILRLRTFNHWARLRSGMDLHRCYWELRIKKNEQKNLDDSQNRSVQLLTACCSARRIPFAHTALTAMLKTREFKRGYCVNSEKGTALPFTFCCQ